MCSNVQQCDYSKDACTPQPYSFIKGWVFSVVLYCGRCEWPYPHLNQMIYQHTHLYGAKVIKSSFISWLLGMCSWRETFFFHSQKFVTCNFVPILNWSKAEPEAFFFELKTERKTVRVFLLLEIRELVWLTGGLASNTLLHGPHWRLERASSLFAPYFPSSLDAGLLTKW